MTNELALDIVKVFAVIGLLDTLYLLYHKLRGTDVWCPFFPDEWCRKVQTAPQSKTFGIPNPILGFFMYVILLAIVFWYSANALGIAKIVIWIGFAFSMYFTYVQAFVLRAFCTWCVLSAVNFTVMFIASFYLIP